MTPARLSELKCPVCAASHWVIDSDFRGIDGTDESYAHRIYRCPACGESGAGHQVLNQSPPEFFLQPHRLYPMGINEFARWARIFEQHFPDSERLQNLGVTWYPTEFDDQRPRSPEALRNDRFYLLLRPGKQPTVLAQPLWGRVFESSDGTLSGEPVFALGPPVALMRKHTRVAGDEVERIAIDEVTRVIDSERAKLLRAWRQYKSENDRRRADLLRLMESGTATPRRPSRRWWPFDGRRRDATSET